MESLTPKGFLAALTEVSARLAETKAGKRGVGVISLYAQPDAALYRLPLEHLRRFERAMARQIRAQLRVAGFGLGQQVPAAFSSGRGGVARPGTKIGWAQCVDGQVVRGPPQRDDLLYNPM